MRRPLILASCALLAACGNDPNGNTSFETGFHTSFRSKFVEQCTSSVRNAPAGATIDATPLCGCAADKLMATKTISELMHGPTTEETQAVVRQCLAEHPIAPAARTGT